MNSSNLVFPATFSFDFAEPEHAWPYLAPHFSKGIKVVGFTERGDAGHPEITVEFPSLQVFREFAYQYLAPAHGQYPEPDDVNTDVEEMTEEFIKANTVKAPTVNVNGSPGITLVQDYAEVNRALTAALYVMGRATPHGRDYPQGKEQLDAAREAYLVHVNNVVNASKYAEKMALAIDAQL